jgi:hypothetical protein
MRNENYTYGRLHEADALGSRYHHVQTTFTRSVKQIMPPLSVHRFPEPHYHLQSSPWPTTQAPGNPNALGLNVTP